MPNFGLVREIAKVWSPSGVLLPFAFCLLPFAFYPLSLAAFCHLLPPAFCGLLPFASCRLLLFAFCGVLPFPFCRFLPLALFPCILVLLRHRDRAVWLRYRAFLI